MIKNNVLIITILILITIFLPNVLAQSTEYGLNWEKICNDNGQCTYKQYKNNINYNHNGLIIPLSQAININYDSNSFNVSTHKNYVKFKIGMTYDNSYYDISEIPTNSNPQFKIDRIDNKRYIKYNLVSKIIGLNPTKINNIIIKVIDSSNTPVYYEDKIIIGELIFSYNDVLGQGMSYDINPNNNEIVITEIPNSIIGDSMMIDPQISLVESNTVADTYINEGSPNSNFGSTSTMVIQSHTANDRLSIITWNVTGVLPSNATNISSYMNLTEQNPTAPIQLSLHNSSNFTWIETSMTYNNFFCNVNSTGQIVPNNVCSEEVTQITTQGINNAKNKIDTTGTIGINTNFVTYVMDDDGSSTNTGTYNTKEGVVSEDPLLVIKWDETPPPPTTPVITHNPSLDVKTTSTTANIYWTTSQKSNSTIRYGFDEDNLSFIFTNNSLITMHNFTITGLTPNTIYFYNLTSSNINGSDTVGTFSFTTKSEAIQQIDIENIDSCMDFPNSMTINDETGHLYVYGDTLIGNEKIGVFNVSSNGQIDQLSCLSVGNTGDSKVINYLPRADDTTGVSGYLLASIDPFASTQSLKIFNISTSGTTLTLTKAIEVSNTGLFEATKGNALLGDDNIITACGNDRKIYEINRVTETVDETLTMTGSNNCLGISETYSLTGNNLIIATLQNEGQRVIQNKNSQTYTDSLSVTSNSWDRIEKINTGDTEGLISIASTDIQFYSFDNDNVNNNNVSPRGTYTGVGSQSGNAWINTEQYLSTSIDPVTGDIDLILLDTTDIDNPILEESVETNQDSSSARVTIIYDFPYSFVLANNGSSGGNSLASYTITQTTYNETNNKKPEVQNLRTLSGNTNAVININKTILYDVENPETLSIGEEILTTGVCTYEEETQFINTFVNTTVCELQNIGTIKSNNYGTGLNLTACFNDFVLTGTESTTGNMIISFDVYSKKNIDSSATISFIQFNGDIIETFNIIVNNNTLKLRADTRTLLSIDIDSVTGNIPTRLFFQLNPTSSITDIRNKIYVSTNKFNEPSATLDKTFCDTSEFCYIGDFNSVTPLYNNFYGLLIDSATGNIAIDNFKVKTTNDYEPYTQTTSTSFNSICKFNETGTKTVRVYASDEVFGNNYLSFKDLVLTVTSTQILLDGEEGDFTIVNGSITQILNDVANVSGIGQGDKLILSLIVILIGMFAVFKYVEDAMFSVAGALVVGIVLTLIFVFIGWLNTLSLIILLIMTALAGTYLLTKPFINNG